MKVAIHSMQCPRIEVDFIEKWIEHHRRMGINKIFIYNTGSKIFYESKPTFIKRNGTIDIERKRRPYLDYDKRTDKEIDKIWKDKLDKYRDFVEEKIIDHKLLLKTSKVVYNRNTHDLTQATLNIGCLPKYINEGYDWIFNIDGDEFIEGNLEYLNDINIDIGRVVIKPVYYPERWYDSGKPIINFEELKPSIGTVPRGLEKNAVRPESIIKWTADPHRGMTFKSGYTSIIADIKQLFFKHYREGAIKDTAVNNKKSIIVVGNGPSLLEKENGNIIDNFDIVVRFSWYHINGYEKHVGTKTSYWFTTVACPTRMKKSYDRVYEHSWEWNPEKDNNYKKLIENGFSPIKIKRTTIEEMQEFVENSDYFTYSTGAIAIWELLKEYNSLIITGFDWWKESSIHHYGDNQRRGNIHKPDKEFRFIEKLLNEKRINFL